MIRFKAVACSSDDEGYSASELQDPSPSSKGWRSDQYCTYPQEIVLQLEKRSNLDRIQIMTHNTMIPSSAEIFLGDVPNKDEAAADPSRVMYMSLGSVSWSNNKDFGFKGRQMQTVEFAGGTPRGLFVKLVLKKNHINR